MATSRKHAGSFTGSPTTVPLRSSAPVVRYPGFIAPVCYRIRPGCSSSAGASGRAAHGVRRTRGRLFREGCSLSNAVPHLGLQWAMPPDHVAPQQLFNEQTTRTFHGSQGHLNDRICCAGGDQGKLFPGPGNGRINQFAGHDG